MKPPQTLRILECLSCGHEINRTGACHYKCPQDFVTVRERPPESVRAWCFDLRLTHQETWLGTGQGWRNHPPVIQENSTCDAVTTE